MPDLLHTGPYAAFILPAYALTAVALAWMVVDSLLSARRWRRRAERPGGRREAP